MPSTPSAPQSPFAMALAARKGTVPPESLTSAARHLFKDTTLSQSDLSDFASTRKPAPPKTHQRIHRTAKGK